MQSPIDVNSDAWKQLSDVERYDLLEPIFKRFATKYRNLPNINHMGHCPDWIYVSTSLPHGTLMKEFPDTFEGVPVKQEAVREEMDRFIATWSMILDRIASWHPDRISEFANDHNILFRTGWFLHESPVYHVLGELVSETAGRTLGFKACVRIQEEILAGISKGADPWYPDLDPNYDWDAARDRVAAANREMERLDINRK